MPDASPEEVKHAEQIIDDLLNEPSQVPSRQSTIKPAITNSIDKTATLNKPHVEENQASKPRESSKELVVRVSSPKPGSDASFKLKVSDGQLEVE
jgi:hypothetical protein